MRKTLDNMDIYSFTDMYSADNNGIVYILKKYRSFTKAE